MKRRGRHGAAMSLFAFQDVMASVIGILFLVVLLMSLDIVNQQAPAASMETVTTDAHRELQDTLGDLTQQLEQLQKQARQLVHDKNLAASGEDHLLEELATLRQTLAKIRRSITEHQEQLVTSASKGAEQKQQYQDKLQQLQDAQQQLAQLNEQLRLAEDRPPMTYILDQADPMQPWLVELTDRTIRVASADGPTIVLEFRADEFATRKQQLIDWAKSQNRVTHYFVIMKKPSALQYGYEIEKAIKAINFDIGKDLIPEDYELF